MDAKVIVELLETNNSANRAFSSLLDDCRSLLDRFHQVRVEHVFREGNKGADVLARRGTVMLEIFVIFDFPPNSDILSIVNMDVSGMHYCRFSIVGLASMAR